MNKKKILTIGFIAIFAAVVAFNVSVSSSNNALSDLSLANVEALAKNEGDWNGYALAIKSNGDYCCAPWTDWSNCSQSPPC